MKVLCSNSLEVKIDQKTLTLSVKDLRTGFVWQMQERGPGDAGIKGHAGPWAGMHFRSALQRKWESRENGFRVILFGWPYSANVWAPAGLGVELIFELDDNELSITVAPWNEKFGEVSLIDSYYPRGFVFPEGVEGQLVLPYGQGCLLNKTCQEKLDHTLPSYVGIGFVMPWWGQLAAGGEGLIALTETPDDIGFRLVTDEQYGNTVHPYWMSSLGSLKYARKIKYRFYEQADVTLLAKEYRCHADSLHRSPTLKEKAVLRPNVELLRGGMVISLHGMVDYSRSRPGGELKQISFCEGLAHYQRLVRDCGIRKAIAHVDGWGQGGYDFMHPDVLPPDERLGGWAGLNSMAKALKAMGHGILLHDNYADYYHASAAFKNGDSVMDLGREYPESAEWLGGMQHWLCPEKAVGYASGNLTEVERKLHPNGTYIDCFSISILRECFDQRHPCNRSDARRHWSEIFELCNKFGWATSSEGGADWAMPYLDFCWCVYPEMVPFDLREKIPYLGIPIPLYNLVWHDCIVVPAFFQQKSAVKDIVVTAQHTDMRCWMMLWAGIPSVKTLSMNAEAAESCSAAHEAEFVRQMLPAVELSEHAGFEEMISLKLLTPDGRVQATEFSDGTEVTVDFERKEAAVKYFGMNVKRVAFD